MIMHTHLWLKFIPESNHKLSFDILSHPQTGALRISDMECMDTLHILPDQTLASLIPIGIRHDPGCSTVDMHSNVIINVFR